MFSAIEGKRPKSSDFAANEAAAVIFAPLIKEIAPAVAALIKLQ